MISKKYKEVIKNLEENIDSKRDLEYAKKQIVKRLTIGSLPLETRRGGLL